MAFWKTFFTQFRRLILVQRLLQKQKKFWRLLTKINDAWLSSTVISSWLFFGLQQLLAGLQKYNSATKKAAKPLKFRQMIRNVATFRTVKIVYTILIMLKKFCSILQRRSMWLNTETEKKPSAVDTTTAAKNITGISYYLLLSRPEDESSQRICTMLWIIWQEISSCWNGRPLGQNRNGPKSGGLLCSFPWGELGSHLTQCRLGQGLPLYQVASWSIYALGHNTPTLQTDRQTNRTTVS